MGFIESENAGKSVQLYYEDYGQGKPVVFIHGWPLNHQMWEYQLTELPRHGLRCIVYDRRGFGKSDKPWEPYNYNAFADDLKAVIAGLNLEDVTLVGFSMGGGEVARYFSRHGGAHVSKVILLGSVLPYLHESEEAAGNGDKMIEGIVAGIKNDRPGFFAEFGKAFYGVDVISNKVSEGILNWNLLMTLQASAKATTDCVYAFAKTDFREELGAIKVPTLIIHGGEDKVVPPNLSSEKAAKLIPGSRYVVYEDQGHGLYYTAKDRLNEDILNFVNE